MQIRPIRRIMLLPLLSVMVGAPVASADPVFSFSQDNLAAEVTFAQAGNTLLVTLENTSMFDVFAPEDLLTAVYFNIDNLGANVLTPQRAILSDGSFIQFPVAGDGTDSNGEIGGEYGFRDDLPNNLFGPIGLPIPSMVISAVGLDDLIGPPNVFPGENLAGPPSGAPNGIGYGLVSAGENPATGNMFVTGMNPLVRNGVVFELAGLPNGFILDGNVGDVLFNYGSGFNPIPEPGTLLLSAMGVAALITSHRRRRRCRSASSTRVD